MMEYCFKQWFGQQDSHAFGLFTIGRSMAWMVGQTVDCSVGRSVDPSVSQSFADRSIGQ